MGKEQLRQFILEYLSPADYSGRLKTSRNYEKYRKENPNVRSVTGGRRGEDIPVTPRTKVPVMSSKRDVPSAGKDRRSDAEIDRLSQIRQQRVDKVKKGRRSLADRGNSSAPPERESVAWKRLRTMGWPSSSSKRAVITGSGRGSWI